MWDECLTGFPSWFSSVSCISPTRVPRTDYMCDRRIKEQVAEAIWLFSQTHSLRLLPASRRSWSAGPVDDEMSLRSFSSLLFPSWIWVLLDDLLLLQEICCLFIQDRSLFFPPQEISYSTNLSSPFFPGAPQGPSYISHTARANNMDYAFNRDQYKLSQSEVRWAWREK